ncbi:DUF2853 family protein [Litorimonas haliclonae]|uniref:DUF2853 family protein n=1 Tax=Litorimonas haliclonae TaxID=2081977 RepID=UPI0039EE55A3
MNLSYIIGYLIVPMVIAALIGLFLGWLLFRGKKQEGDLSVEGEKALRAEADKLRTENQALKGRLSANETEVSDLKGKLASAGTGASVASAAPAAQGGDDDETYALEWRNRYLAARVKYLEGRLSEAPKAKAKKAPAKKAATKKPASKKKATAKTAASATAKTKTAKKPAPKKAAAKKTTKPKAVAKTAAATKTKRKPGPKPGTKRGELTAAGKPRKKPGPKPGSTRAKKPKVSKEEAAFEKYYTNVKKYDSKAKRKTVENIVKYCGVALRSRDSSLVACSDEAELKRVADGFVTKKLEKDSGQMELVKKVCQEMKGDRFKSRVTFYYLAAKKARKMSLFN